MNRKVNAIDHSDSDFSNELLVEIGTVTQNNSVAVVEWCSFVLCDVKFPLSLGSL